MARFVIVPEWQGSPAARAMLLASGAEQLAGDLPAAACTFVEVPDEAGEPLGTGIRRYSALQRVQRAIGEAMAGDPVLVVGGDCAVAVPAIGAAAAAHERLAVVWFDAHADFHTAETSPSGAFAGMALRAVTGDGPLAASPPVAGTRMLLVGARAIDEGEAPALEAAGVEVLPVDADTVADAVAALDADAVWVHVDVDVLDPAAITGVSNAVPFGADLPQALAAIAAVRAALPLAGASIAGFAPQHPDAAVDDLGTLLRLVGALV